MLFFILCGLCFFCVWIICRVSFVGSILWVHILYWILYFTLTFFQQMILCTILPTLLVSVHATKSSNLKRASVF